LYILIKCIFKSVDIIFKLLVKYLNYFEVSKKIEVFLDLFILPFIFLPTGKSPLLCRYVTHLSIVVFTVNKSAVWPFLCRLASPKRARNLTKYVVVFNATTFLVA
jgi:hypothetical protein